LNFFKENPKVAAQLFKQTAGDGDVGEFLLA
jgi:hypothetical protein